MSSSPEDLISDDELQKFTVGEVTPHNAPIFLADYDPDWPRLFAREAARIRGLLGDTAVRIEHVGSTSVPGLVAKPIIDMLLVVPDSADEPAYVPALESAGYLLRIREPDWFEHRVFKGPDTNINLHVFSTGATDSDRDLYAKTKRELATRTWRHIQHYADAKTSVIAEIVDRANSAE